MQYFLSTELELHEITVGLFSLSLGSLLSSALACWVMNGGFTTMYYNVNDHGILWWIVQWPVVFISQDYLTYWAHRIYHWPLLYKHFHKLHHTYKQPTAFSVTAIHPVEFVSIQMIYILPMFTLPVHYVPFCSLLIYIYGHGLINHSGINFKHFWWQPWQPDTIHHDNHHQYFHVNFGFNIEFWDHLHGTARRKDRVYHEGIFGGVGKSLTDATTAEIERDLVERRDENPLAYQQNKMAFELTEEDIVKIKFEHQKAD